MAYLVLAARWLLAVVLIGAGVAKLPADGRDAAAQAIENYGVLPRRLRRPAAAALPYGEITLGLLLCLGVLLRVSADCVAVMLGAFAASVGWHVQRGHRFGCGCGGGGSISWSLAARDGASACLAAVVAWRPSSGLALLPGWGAVSVHASARSLLPVPLVVIVLLVLVRVLIMAGLNSTAWWLRAKPADAGL